ncbi:stage III sporulation protein AG [Falsibacillus albus]|uniref:Stage III sporulation protein AG n=1 Tax=Falsibacillus albus TaxID=2478915 RepID=A0A3L7K5C3_9BACI|nr:stage III sporulation protein AG [Falsibacillus albus]RLQ98273.1 stage III sporulation protein AG [Falsibacillus albus]
MSGEKGPIDWLKSLLLTKSDSSKPSGKKIGKLQYFLIILICGIAFMLISDLWRSGNDQASSPAMKQAPENGGSVETFGSNKDDKPKSMADYEKQYENELKEALDQIVGVSNVTVVVNVEASEQKVFEKDSKAQNQITNETDPKGGERKIEEQTKDDQLVIVKNGDKEVPIVKETRKPEIKGVLVVANGADNIQIKKWIIEAVTRVLDVPSHQVAVMPKKSKGDS